MYIYRDRGGTGVTVPCYKCIYIDTAVGQWLKCCATNVYIYIYIYGPLWHSGYGALLQMYIYIYIYRPRWDSGYGAVLQMYIYRDRGGTVVKMLCYKCICICIYIYRDRCGTVVMVLCYKCIYIGTAVGEWLKCCATNVYIYIGTAVAQWLWCCATNVYI